MDREEILAKSRLESRDEGLTAAENQGRRIGQCTFILVFAFIVIFNAMQGQSSYGAQAMFWAFMAAEAFPRYRFTRRMSYLIVVIAGSITSIMSLLSMVLQTLR